MFGSKKKDTKKQEISPRFFGELFVSNGKTASSVSSKKPIGSHRNSYDDGYDDVYLDEKYDKDRYKRDRDYRNGVEDATLDLLEEEEDW